MKKKKKKITMDFSWPAGVSIPIYVEAHSNMEPVHSKLKKISLQLANWISPFCLPLSLLIPCLFLQFFFHLCPFSPSPSALRGYEHKQMCWYA